MPELNRETIRMRVEEQTLVTMKTQPANNIRIDKTLTKENQAAEAKATGDRIAEEATARAAADTALQQSIAAETEVRASTDTALQQSLEAETAARASAVSAEIANRENGDTLLQSQIDQIIAPSGEAPSAAEVENARIDVDGEVHATLGEAIREQVQGVKSALNALTKSVDFDYSLAETNHYGLTSNGVWNKSNAQTSCVFAVPNDVKKIKVTAGANGAILGFLNTFEPVPGSNVDFSPDYATRITLAAGATAEYEVTDTVNFMFTLLVSLTSVNQTPTTELVCPVVAVDKELNIPGIPADAAACGEVAATSESNEQDLIHLNVHNYLKPNKNETTAYGVKYTPDGKGSYTIERVSQSTSISVYNLTNTSDPLTLYDLYPGATCYIGIQGANDCILQIYSYDADGVSTILGSAAKSRPEVSVTIPETANSILVRLRIASDVAISETVYPYLSLRPVNNIANSIIPRVTYGRPINDNEGAITTETVTVDGVVTEVSTVHLDAVRLPGYYIIDYSSVVDGAPEEFRPQFIKVENLRQYVSDGFIRQTIGRMTTQIDTVYYRFTNASGTFTDWAQMASGSGSGVVNNYTYHNTNTFETTVNQNTYSVTATPSITSDYLYYLAPRGDASDRTADIATMLATSGVCRLGAGTYYIGNLQMPNYSSIIGVGARTVIRLLDSVTDGYAIRMGEACSIRDCVIRGANSYNARTHDAATPGTRVGVLWSGADNVLPTRGMLTNIRFENFKGSGILCRETTMLTYHEMVISNCFFTSCDAGINIAYLSEFHQINNCHFYGCYYGVINNGGNNNFSNCDFASNATHFLIDNSNGELQNPAHAIMSNCEMAHAYGLSESGELISNAGKAIEIIGVQSGYNFTGCAFGYGEIVLTDAGGITFTGCAWSGATDYNVIKITRGTGILFNGCTFGTNPTVERVDNDVTRFINCYTKDGLTNITV